MRPDGSHIQCEYDLDGQLVGLTDAQSRNSSWTYDWQGRLTAAVEQDGAIEVTYDQCGNMVSSKATIVPKGLAPVTFGISNRSRQLRPAHRSLAVTRKQLSVRL